MKYCSAPSKRCAVEELLGPEHAQRVEELRADLVLSAVAARGRDERHPRPDVPRVERQRGVVLVVWVRGHVHDRPDRRRASAAPATAPARPVRSVSGWMRYWGTGCWAPAGHCSATAAATAAARNRDILIGSPREGRCETVMVSCPFGRIWSTNLGNLGLVPSVYTRCQPALRRLS